MDVFARKTCDDSSWAAQNKEILHHGAAVNLNRHGHSSSAMPGMYGESRAHVMFCRQGRDGRNALAAMHTTVNTKE